MNVVSFLYAFLLFFILTPGILLTLPKKGKKMMVAGVHALIFAVVFTLTHHWIMKITHSMFEGFTEGAKGAKNEKPAAKKPAAKEPAVKKPQQDIPRANAQDARNHGLYKEADAMDKKAFEREMAKQRK